MFGVDLSELVIILVVALVVFGPEKLPELARKFGTMMGQFKRTSDSLRREFYNEIYPPAGEIGRELRDATRELRSVTTDLHSAVKKELTQPLAPPPDPAKELEK